MASFQIACPHCASTLSFGQAVQAGAVLSCLICNRTFTALAATAAAPTSAAPSRGSASPSVAKAPGMQPIPVAKAPAAPRSAATAQYGKSAAQAGRSKTSGGAGRVVGGLVLAAIALLMLGGLGYLFWTNVLADRLAGNGKDSPSPVVAQRPTNDADQDKAKGLPPPPVANTKDSGQPSAKDGKAEKKKGDEPSKDSGELDVADAKKLDTPPPPPLTEAIVKKEKDEDKKIEPVPIVPIKVPPPPIAPGVDAERIDAAIARGVGYLKKHQQADGTWPGAGDAQLYTMGVTALCGLALLECNVPANDPAVVKAAQFIRNSAMKIAQAYGQTYDISASILFLSRLGEPRDNELIQQLAIRLAAAQMKSGGWGYNAPAVSDQNARQIHTQLQTHWPWSGARPRPAGDIAKLDPKEVKKGQPPLPVVNLQKLPANELDWNVWFKYPQSAGDNSNTQFALLALWTARRHGVPVECPILQSYQRFVSTQSRDGGWGYSTSAHGGAQPLAVNPMLPPMGVNPAAPIDALESKPTMTCVGLLGLAMGHGAVPAVMDPGVKNKLANPAIQKGLETLSKSVGSPSPDANARPPMGNLYFLWSVERVAVLYDLKTIGGKDWYGWGAQILLSNQRADGNWTGGGYLGAMDSLDTCFALLFLKRANLVQDLTESLRLNMVIRDPGAK